MSPNLVSLHTSEGCQQPPIRQQKGYAYDLFLFISADPTCLRIPVTNDCNANVNFNTGCGVKVQNELSYGIPFNAVGGGWYVPSKSPRVNLKRSVRYALERTAQEIKVWFWARNDPTVPPDVQKRFHHSRGSLQSPVLGDLDQSARHPDTLVINTLAWGPPDVRFVQDQCNIPYHFKPQKIVINLTFCMSSPPLLCFD